MYVVFEAIACRDCHTIYLSSGIFVCLSHNTNTLSVVMCCSLPDLPGCKHVNLLQASAPPQTSVAHHLPSLQVAKLDTETREMVRWNEDNCWPSEPVFIPRPNGESEDDGASVILCVCVCVCVLPKLCFSTGGPSTVSGPTHWPPRVQWMVFKSKFYEQVEA